MLEDLSWMSYYQARCYWQAYILEHIGPILLEDVREC